MKTFCAFILTSASAMAYAGSPMDSAALEGRYSLTKASSEYAAQFHCSEKIEITVTEKAVTLNGTRSYASFKARDTTCQRQRSDIGPLRTTCTAFSQNSVFESLTEPITTEDYIKETETVYLLGESILIHRNDVTQLHLGFSTDENDDEFKCEYRRVSGHVTE